MTNVERWSREWHHKRALQKIRDDHAAWLTNFHAQSAARRRRDEAISRDYLRMSVRLASQNARAGRKAFPIALAEKYHNIHLEETQVTPAEDRPFLAPWRRQIEDTARNLHHEISWAASPMNAYAFVAAKRIEISPIVSAWSYASARHEQGHCARPCQPRHRRVPSKDDPKKTLCVRCELDAWRWAIETAHPRWSARMHACLRHALLTYRPYATASEAREIDELASGLGFRRAQLTRLLRRTA